VLPADEELPGGEGMTDGGRGVWAAVAGLAGGIEGM
jgi:hypothetical protein